MLLRILKYSGLLLLLWAVGYTAWFALWLPDISVLADKNPETTALIELRREQAAAKGEKFVIRQNWVGFSYIPANLKKAILVSEDGGFYSHRGIDWFEFNESFRKNLEKGEISRGGSTISQQLIKNLYLSPKRSLTRKLIEFFLTLRMEKMISKDRIFHIYLNVIEFGPGIFGVEAASRFYFHKSVRQLSLEECIRLAAVIPRPLRQSPASANGWLLWKSRWILGKFLKYGYIDQSTYQTVLINLKRKT